MHAAAPIALIHEFYPPDSDLCRILLIHSRAVAERALQIARRLDDEAPDLVFIEEAALLHDIGIYLTNAPAIGCRGVWPYVCHGWLGRTILEQKGLFRHALVCERHVGAGLSAAEIRSQGLALPVRDMQPVSLEEQIICYADAFFSKTPQFNGRPLPFASVAETMRAYGEEKLQRFLQWAGRFEPGFLQGFAASGDFS
ncbi:MAG TPA: HD domain-containing protein [Desulfosalsimonadaceae bacterium]|nr:HD domain-containing protein [Desulfosalsimonadaceae bacterium]